MNVRLAVHHDLPCHINDVFGAAQPLPFYAQVLSDTERNANKR